MASSSRRAKRARALSESAPAEEIASLQNALEHKAHTILWTHWPDKIVSLTTKIQALQAQPFRRTNNLAENAGKTFPIHPEIQSIISRVKLEVVDLVNDLSLMITWVRLMRPRLEDGGNFGVEVQGDILNNLVQGRSSAIAVYSSVTQYYYVRGRILRRLKHAPHCADYAASVHSCDAKQFSESVQILSDLRSIYLMLSDKINKNYDNLAKPKGGTSSRETRELYC